MLHNVLSAMESSRFEGRQPTEDEETVDETKGNSVPFAIQILSLLSSLVPVISVGLLFPVICVCG